MALPRWIEEALATTVRTRLDKLVAARGGTSVTVDEAIDEMRDRLVTREWTGALSRALAGDDDAETRRAIDALAFSICRRRVADELRREWRRQGIVREHVSEVIANTHGASTPAASPETHALLRAVLDAMDRLSESDREAIADAVDGAADHVMDSAARSRLHRARLRLAKELEANRKTGGW